VCFTSRWKIIGNRRKPVVSKWQLTLCMPEVWRKKQRLKSLPDESHKCQHFCPGFVEQTRVVVLDFIFPDYPPIPLIEESKSQCFRGQIHQFCSSAWKLSSKRTNLKKRKITLFLYCSLTLFHPFFELKFKSGVLIISWLNEI